MILIISLIAVVLVLAVSADVTLAGSEARDFEADETERTATLVQPGGLLTNRGVNSRVVWINERNEAVDTDNGNVSSVPIGSGGSHRLPVNCKAFKFKAVGGAEFLKFTRE